MTLPQILVLYAQKVGTTKSTDIAYLCHRISMADPSCGYGNRIPLA